LRGDAMDLETDVLAVGACTAGLYFGGLMARMDPPGPGAG
jgi:hypothetical protein